MNSSYQKLSPSNHQALCLSNLKVEIGQQSIWFHCNCKMERGRLIGILGPNGCGKSTLLRAIVGEVPFSGEISYLGQAFNVVKQRIAYLPQREQISTDFPITVQEFMEIGDPDYFKWKFPWQKTKLKPAFRQIQEELGIFHLIEKQLSQLSGGERRRVYLARLIAQDSDLLLLDEPLAGVDEHGEQLIIKVWKRLVNEGKTIIAVHHDLESVRTIFDEVLLFKHHQVQHKAINIHTNPQELMFA